jgi:membrane-associated phospholipid phosphatase
MDMNPRLIRPLALAAVAAAGIFALMAGAYFVGPVARWDATALHGLTTLSADHRWIWNIGDFFALSADPEFVVAALVCICAAGLLRGRRRQAVAAALLVGGAGLAGALFKVLAAHPRFHPVLGDHQLSDTAFPSGHATAAMSIALATVLVARRGRWRLFAAIAGGAYTLAVSISLVVQGWHFPSDVLAGLLVSTAVAMLVLAGLRATEAPGWRPAGRPWLSMRSDGMRAIEVLAGGLALALAAVAVVFPAGLASFASTHTSALAAAAVIALAAIVLVSALTAELEAG